MLIRLYANRDALRDITNFQNARWIIHLPQTNKTVFAKFVFIMAPGITVFDPNDDGKPRMYLEFDAELKHTNNRSVWTIIT